MPFSSSEIDARCDMDTDGGGWLVIQRRVSGGTENFFRNWTDYEDGFGDLNGEFWYGLKNINCLTTRDEMELRIDLKKDDGTGITWTYQVFKVAGPEDNYRLTIGEGKGPDSFDAMAYHNNQQFSTYDRDNDAWSGYKCTKYYKGGWWYRGCTMSNLNGPHDGDQVASKISWNDGKFIYFPDVQMKIRPKTCTVTEDYIET